MPPFSVADPDLELKGGEVGVGFFCRLLCRLFSLRRFFFFFPPKIRPFPRSATDFESTWPHKQLWLRAFPLLFHPPSCSKSCPSNNYLEITFLLLINRVGQCAVLTLDLFIITASGFALRNSFIPHFTSNVNLHYNKKFPQCWGAEGKENIEVSFFLLNFNFAPSKLKRKNTYNFLDWWEIF